MDINKKFVYVNADTTAGEADDARMFSYAAFKGAEATSATVVVFYFKDLGQADDTTVAITITSGKVKEFLREFVEEVNYGKEAVIILADRSSGESFSGYVTTGTAATIAEGAA